MHLRMDPIGISAIAIAAALAGGCTVVPVTGTSEASLAAGQSETTATTVRANGIDRVLVSFNDETSAGNTIVYAQNSRQVNAGASLMGWAYSENMGGSWTYAGKVATPSGWPVLWGDPAMTTSGASYAIAFLSNLAIPQSKFPTGGINGAVTYGSRGSYIGGACIYRTIDGGKTFQFHQCFGNTEPSV